MVVWSFGRLVVWWFGGLVVGFTFAPSYPTTKPPHNPTTVVISIIGLGLIGGSLAIALRENGFAERVIGVDRNRESEKKALRRFIIDDALPLDEAVAASDLVILAVPVDALRELLPRTLDLVDRQVVTDVGSTKKTLLELVAAHPQRGRFVAGHPMAGTEFSGIEAALPRLFHHKWTVLVDVEQSDADARDLVERMYRSIPMQLTYLDAESHDIHTAYVSHISHVSSFALALTVLEKERDESRIFELASSGFSSTVRLAKSSPEMWVPIFRQNRDNLLDVLDEHINTLARFRSCLIKNDYAEFQQLIERANEIGRILGK